MHDQTPYWIWLNELRGLTLKSKRKLLSAFAIPKEIFQADLTTIAQILLETSKPKEKERLPILWNSKNLKEAEAILRSNEKHNISILTAEDTHYHHIYTSDQNTPLLVYYKGTLAPVETNITAVIGSRRSTSYGHKVTKAAVATLVERKNLIASGLSFGIDALAHKTTLEHHGITYAFIPCGLHKAQPVSHSNLMEKIIETGAVISPYPYGKEALPFRYFGRNNLLAAWCNTLLVIEAGINSGSMYTARRTLDKGKQVFAVPNSIFEPASMGTNLLLSEGAQSYIDEHLLTHEFFIQDKSEQTDDNPIVTALKSNALTTMELKNTINATDFSIMETLTELELAGKIIFKADGKWHVHTNR